MIRHKPLTNLTDLIVPTAVQDYIGKGLKFIPTPFPLSTRLFKASIQKPFGDLQRRLEIKYFFRDNPPYEGPRCPNITLRSDWRPPREAVPDAIKRFIACCKRDTLKVYTELHPVFRHKSNVAGPLQKALRTFTINNDVHWARADKTGEPVLLTKTWYHEETKRNLPAEVYAPIAKNRADAIVRQAFLRIRAFANDWYGCDPDDTQDRKERHFLRTKVKPDTSKYGECYILVKTHKSPPVGRLIVPQHSYITVALSKWLDTKLQPFVSGLHTVCQGSLDFITKLENKRYAPESILSTQDVTALYPSIPLQDAYTRLSPLLNKWFPGQGALMIHAFKLVMELSVFTYREQHYLQLNGTAMGNASAVVFAQLYMYTLEKPLVDEYTKKGWLLSYQRYIDDIFCIFCNRTVATQFVDTFNTLVESIHISGDFGKSVAFLDLRVTLGKTNSIEFTLYQKPTCSHAYLPFSSYHQDRQKLNTVRSELQRFLTHTSDSRLFYDLRRIAYVWFRNRGYTARELSRPFSQVKADDRQTLLDNYANRRTKKKAPFTRTPLVLQRDPLVEATDIRSIFETHYHLLTQVFGGASPELDVIFCNPQSLRDVCRKYNQTA